MHPANSIIQVDGQPCRALGPGVLVRLGENPVGLHRATTAPTNTLNPQDGTLQIRWTTVAALAARSGLPERVIQTRIKALWPAVDLTKPLAWDAIVHARAHGLVYKGETLSLRAVARKLGCSKMAVERRVYRGWSAHDIVERPLRPYTSRDSHAAELEKTGLPPRTAPAFNERGRPVGAFMLDGVVDTVPGHVRRRNRENGVDHVATNRQGKPYRHFQRLCLQTVVNRLMRGLPVDIAFSKSPTGRKERSDKGTKRGPLTKKGKYANFDRGPRTGVAS